MKTTTEWRTFQFLLAAKAVQSGKTGNLRGVKIQRKNKVKEADESKPARKENKPQHRNNFKNKIQYIYK